MNPIHPMSSAITQYLTHFRPYYPGILDWYARIQNEFPHGSRSVFVAWRDSEVQGLAITKNGPRAKLCHISVSPAARDRGLGGTLMRVALANMVYRGAHEIRVTTGEAVFRQHAPYFLGAGFEPVDWQVHRYRRGVSELLWKLEIDPDLGDHRRNTRLPWKLEPSLREGPCYAARMRMLWQSRGSHQLLSGP